MSEQAPPRVTVLGLGRMGAPIASAFLDAGYVTTVWNRTPAKAEALTGRGALRAATAAEAVAASPLVVAPLLDHDAVRRTLDSVGPALRGRTLVNLANVTPEQARELAGRAADRGAALLDGAMMALPETVATPEGFFLYSGSREVFATHRRALEVMAPAHYVGSDPGSAETHSLALLGTGYAALTGFLHSAALLDTLGTAPEDFAPLAARWLRGMAGFVPELAREAGAGSYGGRGLHGRSEPAGGRRPPPAQPGPRDRHRCPGAAEVPARQALGRRPRRGQLLQCLRTAAAAELRRPPARSRN
ncbi:NAD(P)-binding domain-containing protein [Streptomyces sp. URMC 123]|uniref:NAD(P)-binding domain-containing protein n=1 Tax=Streptomyces sp. URMC 123 TaxID=3423403 RepID=UPI003F1AA605